MRSDAWAASPASASSSSTSVASGASTPIRSANRTIHALPSICAPSSICGSSDHHRMPRMEYRRLGKAGLKVSVLSFGSWVSFKDQMGVAEARACMETAYEAGINFFDNAEAYAGGESERIMGAAIAELGWPRYSYVISTKVFWGLHDLPNMHNTINRKYLTQAHEG